MVGSQNNEKRPLTLTDVERRLYRSEAVFRPLLTEGGTLKLDVVVQLKLVRVRT